jgi:hypothetical protein
VRARSHPHESVRYRRTAFRTDNSRA